MTTSAAYDAIADWYEDYVTGAAAAFTDRVRAAATALLGAGPGICLDLCCGTGVHADMVRRLGWTPVGVDLSTGQLGYARGRLPVARADAARLPVASGSVDAVTCLTGHTDLPDYPAVLAEAARVLRPGGRFVHVGIHPCFTGAFADWSDPDRITIDHRYADTGRSFDSYTPHGVRARVGAWHVPLAGLVNGVLDAGLRIERVLESGPGGVPNLFSLAGSRPA